MPINFENINNQTHEILRNIPKWYIRFGSVILVVVFLLILWTSTQIDYPVYYEAKGMVYPSKEKNQLLFKCAIPQEYYTKINEKSKITISLETYPQSAYGAIDAQIDKVVQPTSQSSDFEISVNMKPETKTNINKAINVRPFFKGKAKILIQEESLFKQLFK